MLQESTQQRFSYVPFLMLFLPSAVVSFFSRADEAWQSGLIAAVVVTAICLLLYIVRNWSDLIAGMLGAFVILAILAGCALIPVVGWIADILIILYALGSVWASIRALTPHAVKALAIWGVFLVTLLPPIFHPVGSPVFILIFSIWLGVMLAKQRRPFDEFIFMMSSIPLLAMAIASLGKMFQTQIVMRNAQFQQGVSGYTTRAGVQVGDYTRTITKTIPVLSTSVDASAAAIGAAAGQKTNDDRDA